MLDVDRTLASWGVGAKRPSREVLLRDMPSRREPEDRLMVEAARLALDLVLPGEVENGTIVTRLNRDEQHCARFSREGSRAICGITYMEPTTGQFVDSVGLNGRVRTQQTA